MSRRRSENGKFGWVRRGGRAGRLRGGRGCPRTGRGCAQARWRGWAAAMDDFQRESDRRDSQGHLNVDASARKQKNFRSGARRGPAHASGAIGKVALLRASRGADAGPRDRSPRPSRAVAPSVRFNGLIFTSTRLGKGSRRRTGKGGGREGRGSKLRDGPQRGPQLW